MTDPIWLNPHVMRTGLSWALSWTNGPILCVVSPGSTRFIVVNDQSFLASWEWAEETGTESRFFLVPPFVARTLAGPAAWDLLRLRAALHRNNVALTLHDAGGEYLLQWQWDAHSFKAPRVFDLMTAQPKETLQAGYVAIADAVHLAVANLGRMEGLEQVQRERLAMLIDFAPGRLSIDGQEIMTGDPHRFYFDPRLVIRGLEIARGRTIGFAMTRLESTRQAILYMNSERDNWQVRCALLSIRLPPGTSITTYEVTERERARDGGGLISPRPPQTQTPP